MHPRLRAALIGLGVVVLAVGLAVWALGLVTAERHTGFFAPVWDAEADGLYYIQRDTYGVVGVRLGDVHAAGLQLRGER